MPARGRWGLQTDRRTGNNSKPYFDVGLALNQYVASSRVFRDNLGMDRVWNSLRDRQALFGSWTGRVFSEPASTAWLNGCKPTARSDSHKLPKNGQRAKQWMDSGAWWTVVCNGCPTKTSHGPNVGSMLVHRLQRWPNIDQTLDPCLACNGWDMAESIARHRLVKTNRLPVKWSFCTRQL